MKKAIKLCFIILGLISVSCSSNKTGDNDDKTKLETVEAVGAIQQDLSQATISVTIEKKPFYISLETWNNLSEELKTKTVVNGIRVPHKDGDFILSLHDVVFQYGDGKLNGNYIRGRKDFNSLPTKSEAESIVAQWNTIKSLLEATGKSILKGAYWTKDVVHDENEFVLNYSTFYVFGEGQGDGSGKAYANTCQTINHCHLRLIKRSIKE